MQITIGQTSDDRRKVQKAFSGTGVTVTPKQPLDILSPVFILTWSDTFVSCNYVYCPALQRYYFIDNIVMMTGARAEIHCSVDVLMSHAAEILNLNVYVSRNQRERNKLVVDNMYPTELLSTLTTLKFDATPFAVDSGYNIVMSVVGGVAHDS